MRQVCHSPNQTRRELSEWVLLGESHRRRLQGLTDDPADVFERTNVAIDAETWASSVRLWIDANLPTEIGMFASDPTAGFSVAEIGEFLDVRIRQLREIARDPVSWQLALSH